jgi:hypothetical protein
MNISAGTFEQQVICALKIQAILPQRYPAD